MRTTIANGKDRILEKSANGLPDVSDAVRSFFQALTVGVIVKEMIDGLVEERTSYVDTKGVIMPMGAEKLAIKGEGQRSWKWFEIYCEYDIDVNTDDIMRINSIDYRVMDKSDYSAYGYFKYDVQQAYTKANS